MSKTVKAAALYVKSKCFSGRGDTYPRRVNRSLPGWGLGTEVSRLGQGG